MTHPEITLIIARARNGVIGADGQMPWHVPADLRRFKRLTMGRPMIMGRRTFDSLPSLLDGRRHIVLTRDTAWHEEGAEVAHSAQQALALANAPQVMVIGGAEIYRLFLPIAGRLELTDVDLEPEGDARIDAPDPAKWQRIESEEHAAEGGHPAFRFVTLVRKA